MRNKLRFLKQFVYHSFPISIFQSIITGKTYAILRKYQIIYLFITISA